MWIQNHWPLYQSNVSEFNRMKLNNISYQKLHLTTFGFKPRSHLTMPKTLVLKLLNFPCENWERIEKIVCYPQISNMFRTTFQFKNTFSYRKISQYQMLQHLYCNLNVFTISDPFWLDARFVWNINFWPNWAFSLFHFNSICCLPKRIPGVNKPCQTIAVWKCNNKKNTKQLKAKSNFSDECEQKRFGIIKCGIFYSIYKNSVQKKWLGFEYNEKTGR